MITSGLKLEQGPPLFVPFRFFVAASLFGILGSLLLSLAAPEILQFRWSPVLLALTHLIALGFLLTLVMGAVLQILPVVAGVPVQRVRLVAALVLPCQVIGTLSLCFGLLTSDWSWARYSVLALFAGILLWVAASIQSLLRSRAAGEIIWGLGLAFAGLLLTAWLGGLLALGLNGVALPFFRPLLTDLHLAQGWMTWFFLLIVTVSYQVVPMFFVTRPFPGWIRSGLAPFTFASVGLNLALSVCSAMTGADLVPRAMRIVLVLPVAVYGAALFSLIHSRRRKVPDVSLRFWTTGVILSLGALVLWGGRWGAEGPGEVAVGCLVFSAILSVALGMLHKIVPFLVWFHLQSLKSALLKKSPGKPGPKTPNMKELLSDRQAAITYWSFVLSVASLILAVFTSEMFLLRVSAALWFVVFSLVLRACVSAWQEYRRFTHALS